MASNEKVVNTKIVCLVETNNFAYWIITIRGDMQPLGRTQHIIHEMHRCLIKCVSKPSKSASAIGRTFYGSV
jgi:hypothetical protein